MGLRFSRRVKIAPGVRLNFGLKSISVSAGVRGANLTLGKRGLFGNVGLPGTGLSYRKKLTGGAPIREAERGPAIAELRARAAAANAAIAASLEVHLETPPPLAGSPAFAEPKPRGDMAALAEWRSRRAAHEQRRVPVETDADVRLQARLTALAWPRETSVGFALADGGRCLRLDVDLPELADMPQAELAVSATGEVREKPLSAARRRRTYARHVHAVVFRLVGEGFAALAGPDRIVAAAFTQRVSAATGGVVDDYLLEVEVDREGWSRLRFDALEAIDPQVALETFPLRRDLTRGGEFRTIPAPPWSAA